jgi:hypothetical protein
MKSTSGHMGGILDVTDEQLRAIEAGLDWPESGFCV